MSELENMPQNVALIFSVLGSYLAEDWYECDLTVRNSARVMTRSWGFLACSRVALGVPAAIAVCYIMRLLTHY